ncbi:unnamed protein product [Lampetra planeri]
MGLSRTSQTPAGPSSIRPLVSPRRPIGPFAKKTTLFTLPNFLNHTSVEEVGAVLQQWAWLTRAGCHHSVEWFLCLLLGTSVPLACRPPPHLPCRSFCHVLQDSCWASLGKRAAAGGVSPPA